MSDDLQNLNELYETIILDHYRNPRNSTPLGNSDSEVSLNNPFCGDEITVQLLGKEDAAIADISVHGRGCAISQSAGSLLSAAVKGKSIMEARKVGENFRRLLKGEVLSDDDLETLGDLEVLSGVRRFPVRIKCALLSWSALEESLKSFGNG